MCKINIASKTVKYLEQSILWHQYAETRDIREWFAGKTKQKHPQLMTE